MLAGRIGTTTYARSPDVRERIGGDLRTLLQQRYFDVVLSTDPAALAALRTFAQPSHLLFGTDCPFVDPGMTIDGLHAAVLDAAILRAIERENALMIFPRLSFEAAP